MRKYRTQDITNESLYPARYLSKYCIEIIDGFNIKVLQDILKNSTNIQGIILEKHDDKNIKNKL